MSFSQTLTILCVACCFAPHAASRVRVQAGTETQSATTSHWAQCSWTGPQDSRFSLKFPLKVNGPQGRSCNFACKRQLWDLNSVMSGLFRAEPVEKKCACFLDGDKDTLPVKDATSEDQWFYRFPKRFGGCSAEECWNRYQSIMNFKKDKDLHVAVNNMANIAVSCRGCETKEDCPLEVELPSFVPGGAPKVVHKPGSPIEEDTDENENGPIGRSQSQEELDEFIGGLGIELPAPKPDKVEPKPVVELPDPVKNTPDEDEVIEVIHKPDEVIPEPTPLRPSTSSGTLGSQTDLDDDFFGFSGDVDYDSDEDEAPIKSKISKDQLAK